MKRIRSTDIYKKWIKKLNDSQAKARIRNRIRRLRTGNSGDHRFLGDIFELRIDYGPGYRIYYKDTGKEIIILLCGGDKTTQQDDIARAKWLAMEEEEREDENN